MHGPQNVEYINTCLRVTICADIFKFVYVFESEFKSTLIYLQNGTVLHKFG